MVMFEVNVTNACPYKCNNCIASTFLPPEEDFFNFLEELKKETSDIFIWLTGGEPMLFPDKVERFLKTGFQCQMVTTGLNNTDKLEYLLDRYPTFKVNISISGDPKYEATHRAHDIDYEAHRNTVNKLNRFGDRVMLVSVIFRNAVDGKIVDENLDYIYNTFPNFKHTLMWDRFDSFSEKEIAQVKTKIDSFANMRIYPFPVRKMYPTLFVDGENFRVFYKYKPQFIKIKDCLSDPLGVLHTVETGFNISTIDTKQKCNVYKFYPGCGGPECRYGYNENCEEYWSQFILGEEVKW